MRDALIFAGILVPAIVTMLVGFRTSGSAGQTAVAQQLTAIGIRMDAQGKQLEEQDVRIATLERRERHLIDYIWTLRRILSRNDIEIPEPPGGLEL